MPLPRISDKVHTGNMRGEQKQLPDLLGQDFALIAWSKREGSQGMYAVIQAASLTDDLEPDGDKPFWFITGAANVMEALERIGNDLPVVCSIDRKKSKAGRSFYTIA